MEMTVNELAAQLRTLTDSQQLCLAYSGGLDSHVLLHLLYELKQHYNYQIRAIHIHHGLNPQADQWQQHCQSTCQALNIKFQAQRLNINKIKGQSLEALARAARYQCLSQQLQAKEVLLTAHHLEDQAETFLLQLMRGSGLQGLASMPIKKPFAQSFLLRPLLHVSRQRLEQYAKQQQLCWIEDDSNNNWQFDRNYLRHQIMPLLKKRWPSAATTITRSAAHCAKAHSLLNHVSAKDLAQVQNNNALIDIRKLASLTTQRQQQVLRYWITQQGFCVPSQQQLHEIFRTVIHSRYDTAPCFSWGQQSLRRYRYFLYLMTKQVKPNYKITVTWNGAATVLLPDQRIITMPDELKHSAISFPATIRFRCGGEQMTLKGQRKTLKRLLQQWNIPPWQRSEIPLLFDKEKLIAVLGYTIADGYRDE